jgi:hypothetical protein
MKGKFKKASRESKKLIYDEVSTLNNFKDIVTTKKIIQEEKQKELNKELERVQMIENKFREYNLVLTNDEIQETYDRLNVAGEWVTLEYCRFHLIFLKVMEFEIQRDNYKEIYLENKKEIMTNDKINFTKEEQQYKDDIENN